MKQSTLLNGYEVRNRVIKKLSAWLQPLSFMKAIGNKGYKAIMDAKEDIEHLHKHIF